jgi:hypothetical protein
MCAVASINLTHADDAVALAAVFSNFAAATWWEDCELVVDLTRERP